MKAFVWNIIIERCSLRFGRMAVGEATIRRMLLYVLRNHHFKMWSTVVPKFFLVLHEIVLRKVIQLEILLFVIIYFGL